MFGNRKLESIDFNNTVYDDDELCCFDTIHQCDRQTDRQTQHIPHYMRRAVKMKQIEAHVMNTMK